MEFRTKINMPDFDFDINHKTKCVLSGSCFANNIGEKLIDNKIPVTVNPSGILYNPYSIADSIESALDEKQIEENELFFSNGLWNHYGFHSSFSATELYKCLENLNNALKLLRDSIIRSELMFVSFGTAFTYFLKDTGNIAGNCHKQNQEIFFRKMLSPSEIIQKWESLLEKIWINNQNLKIVYTVSPIRHWKDGATNNQFSKASLFLAIKELKEKYSEKIYYFPAYEIIQDELRDYRFYADDMLHPSETAINYIWEKFAEVFFTEKTVLLNKKIHSINKSASHRPFNSDTEEYKLFCRKQTELIKKIEKEYPYLNFSEEKQYFDSII